MSLINKKPILLFDSECTMCLRFKQGLSFLDNKGFINFVSINDREEFDDLVLNYPELNYAGCHEKVHLITEKGDILMGGNVVNYLLQLVPGVSRLSWLLESDVGRMALDAFYSKVNDVRKSNLNRCEKCKK